MIPEGYELCEVTNITNFGIEETFDIEVENDHEFIANNMVSHNCIGKFHPHGDSACYEALVTSVSKMAQPLAQGKGNWGDDEENAAAQRYTECRMTNFTENILIHPDYLAVTKDFPNFDGELREYRELPAKKPVLLLNGVPKGSMGYGAASTLPPFTEKSVDVVLKHLLKGKKITPKFLSKTLKFNFRYGGVLSDETSNTAFAKVLKNGTGTLVFHADYKIESNKFIIKSAAPDFKISNFLKKLDSKTFNKKELLFYFNSIDDNRSDNKIEIVLTLKPSIQGKERRDIFEIIEKMITVNYSFNFNINILNERGVQELWKTNYIDFFNWWIKKRIGIERRVVKRLMNIERQELKKDNWMIFIIDNLDAIIKIVRRKGVKREQIVKDLIKFGMEEEQAEFTLRRQLVSLSNVEISKVKKRIKERKKTIKYLKKDYKNVNKRILREL